MAPSHKGSCQGSSVDLEKREYISRSRLNSLDMPFYRLFYPHGRLKSDPDPTPRRSMSRRLSSHVPCLRPCVSGSRSDEIEEPEPTPKLRDSKPKVTKEEEESSGIGTRDPSQLELSEPKGSIIAALTGFWKAKPGGETSTRDPSQMELEAKGSPFQLALKGLWKSLPSGETLHVQDDEANLPAQRSASHHLRDATFPSEKKFPLNKFMDNFSAIFNTDADTWGRFSLSHNYASGRHSIYKNDLAAPGPHYLPGDHVTFNVGGQRFQTLISSISNQKCKMLKLKDPEFMINHWDPDRQEYFFDRDPVAFAVVLNYLRTGKLHLPQDMCSPLITDELIYWGLSRTTIEPCCWKDFSLGIQQIENLRKLERDRQPIYLRKEEEVEEENTGTGCCHLCTKNIWDTIADEGSSRVGKIYAMVSLFGISVSLITFVVESVYHKQCKEGEISTTCDIFNTIDLICFIFFLFDIALHFVYCPKVCETFKSLGFYIDALALAPEAATVFMMLIPNISQDGPGFAVLETMTLLRVVRLFRFMRRLTGVMIVIYSLWKSIKELTSLLTILFVTTAVFASFVTMAEEASSSSLENFADGVWYSLITLTTVGYGDVVPITVFGKIIGAVCAVWGVLILGITIPTMVSNFTQYHLMMHYIKERESIFLYQRYSNLQQIPNIPFPEFL